MYFNELFVQHHGIMHGKQQYFYKKRIFSAATNHLKGGLKV